MRERRKERVDITTWPPAHTLHEALALHDWALRLRSRSTAERHPGTRGGSFVVDETGFVLAFDRGMERLLGWTREDVIGRHKNLGYYGPADDLGVRPFEMRPLYHGLMPPQIQGGARRMTLTRKDGVVLDVVARVSPGFGRGRPVAIEVERVVGRFGVPADLARQVPIDPLTELPSHGYFEDRLRACIESARERGQPVSLLAIDVDHLRAIYETAGTARGDVATREVAGLLRATLRESDAVARFDQGDFGVLLEGACRGDARRVGGRLRASIEEMEMGRQSGAPGVRLTVSIGAACFPGDGEQCEMLLRRAQSAKGEAQRLGRNRVWCYIRRPRVVAHFPVYFDGTERSLLGLARDISSSGVFVETGSALPDGARLALALDLPQGDGVMQLVGRVARRVSGPPSALPGVGVEFETLFERDRRRLERFVLETLVCPGV